MSKSPGGARDRTLWYVSCELLAEGTAGYSHVFGIIRGLEARGWQVRLWQPAARAGRRGALRRLADIGLMSLQVVTRRSRPDVLYVRGHLLSLPVVAWARLRRVPVAVELNGPGDDVLSGWPGLRPLMPVFRRLGRAQTRLATVVIAVTDGLAARSRGAGARRTATIPNGVDLERFDHPGPPPSGLPPTFVVFVGALAAWQGLQVVVQALDEPAWPADTSLVVVGDGALAGWLADQAATRPRIVCLGRLPAAAVPSVLSASHIALSPMVDPGREATGVVPLKLFEAFAAGVPVIATDLPGQAEIVRAAGAGLVVAPGDPAALAEAVARLIGHPDEAAAMGARGRTGAGTHSWDARAATTDALLREILE